MDTPKFLRKYKIQWIIIKYVIGAIAVMYLASLCTYLISCTDTVCCIFGMLILVVLALLVGTTIYDNIKKLKNLVK